MSICDTGFIIRLIEFNLHRNINPDNYAITDDVESELVSKNYSNIKDDLDRIRQLDDKYNLDITLVSKSSFSPGLSWFNDTCNIRHTNTERQEQNCTDSEILNLDAGEKSCFFSKTDGEYLLTEDFEAYNVIFQKTDGEVACLIEILADSNQLTDEKEDIIRVLDALFVPEHKLDGAIWSIINKKIEDALDERIEIS